MGNALVHHDSRPYEVAAAEAVIKAKEKLHKIMITGKEKATRAIVSIMDEYKLREDMLIPAPSIKYELAPEGASVRAGLGDRQVDFTDHSLGQLFERIGLPRSFASKLAAGDPWAKDLLQHNLRTLTDGNLKDDRLLFRVVGDKVKGVLSSAYRRMDASPIFQSFLTAGINHGLVPVDGVNTDTRYHCKMLRPEVYEPAPNEVVAFGYNLTTSDYGAGAMTLQMFIMRLWCTNFAIGENCLRKVHMGKRFVEDGLALSQKTYDLDNETVASAINDIVGVGLDQKAEEYCGVIAKAHEQQIDVRKALDGLRKKGTLTKDEALRAETLYETVDEITLLPQDKSAWRFSNVLSLLAQSANGDKKIDLEEAAMEVLV